MQLYYSHSSIVLTVSCKMLACTQKQFLVGILQVLASCLKNCSHRNAIISSLQSGMKQKSIDMLAFRNPLMADSQQCLFPLDLPHSHCEAVHSYNILSLNYVDCTWLIQPIIGQHSVPRHV